MARNRSPNYPAVGLREAIRRVEAIYNAEGKNPAPREVMIRHMGFGGVNGASLSVLSAVIKFGLLEAAGDKELRVSPLALSILYPHTDSEKAQSIIQAAEAPALFQEINNRFPGPPSDDSLRAYLVRSGFAKTALDPVIRAYRDTMELVNESRSDIIEELSGKRAGTADYAQAIESTNLNPKMTARVAAPTMAEIGTFRVSLTDDFLLDVTGLRLDREGVSRLIRALQANAPILTEKPPPSDNGDHQDGSEREDG